MNVLSSEGDDGHTQHGTTRTGRLDEKGVDGDAGVNELLP
jgi:hypothetical protein